MALQFTDANGSDRYLKIGRVVHNNNEKAIRVVCLIGAMPATPQDFAPASKAFVMLAATDLTGDSLPAAYAHLKTLPEYVGAVDA